MKKQFFRYLSGIVPAIALFTNVNAQVAKASLELNLKEFIFLAATKGYSLVLAHPERYLYLQENFGKAEDLLNRGLLFQLNISSLSGYYSKEAQRIAKKLIDKGWVHLLGSDCHLLQHVKLIEEAQHMKYFRKALTLPILNNSL